MTLPWYRALLACVAWAALASGFGVAVAQAPEGALTGTLLKARTSGVVAIGYREASIPLSYLSPRNEPIGYSIDLCRAIVDAMSTELKAGAHVKGTTIAELGIHLQPCLARTDRR